MIKKFISVVDPLTGQIVQQFNPAYIEDQIPQVPSWALGDQKPAYTAEEIGAVSYLATQNITSTQRAQARSNINAAEEWAQVLDGDTSILLADKTFYDFSETLTELNISAPDEFWHGSMAYICFGSGETATAVTFDGITFNGSVEPNSVVEISISGRIALIKSVPTAEFEISAPTNNS